MTIQNLKDVRVHFDNPLANLKRDITPEHDGRFTASIDTQARDYQVQFMRGSSVGKTTSLSLERFGADLADRRYATFDLAGALALEFETEQQESVKRLRALQEKGMAELRRLLRGHFGKLAPPPSEVYNWDLPYALRGVEDEPYNRQLHTYAGRFYGMPRLRTIAAYVQIALEDWAK